MKMIDDNILEFQDNTEKFLKDSTVNAAKRKENFDILDNIKTYAKGEIGILSIDDSQLMKAQIQRMISKITNLKSNKEMNKQMNREVDFLAHNVLKLWA